LVPAADLAGLPKTDLRLCIPIVRSVESSLEHADEAIVEEPQEAE
jgi:hypothetical protein